MDYIGPSEAAGTFVAIPVSGSFPQVEPEAVEA
jgi:hypothetical protein